MSGADSSPTVTRRRVSTVSDRFTLSYTALTFVSLLLNVFGSEFDRVFNLYLLLVPLILVSGAVVLAILVGALILHSARRQWHRVFSVVLAPPLAAIPLVVCSQFGITPTQLRFEFTRGQYEREIASMERQPGSPLLKAFDWGETGGATGPNIFLTLVYDESDQIGLEPPKRSQDWIDRAEREPRIKRAAHDFENTNIQKLDKYFYLITKIY